MEFVYSLWNGGFEIQFECIEIDFRWNGIAMWKIVNFGWILTDYEDL